MTEIIRQLDSVAWWLVDIAIKSTVLLLIVHGLDRMLLKRRPIATDTLWSATLAMLVLLPLACLYLPRYAVPLPVRFTGQVVLPTANIASSGQTVESMSDLSPSVEWQAATPHNPSLAASRFATTSTVPAQENAHSRLSGTDFMPVAAVVYCLGVAVFATRLAIAFLALRTLRRNSVVVSCNRWHDVLRDYKQQLGIRRDVALCQSSSVSVPLTLGWRRPIVILPLSELNEADPDTLRFVLLHELTHVARGDYPAHIVSKMVQCVYWYHPLVWFAMRRLGQVREAVCDGFCIASRRDREGYVQVLLRFAGGKQMSHRAALALSMVRVSRLEQRLTNLTPVDRFGAGRTVRLASSLMAVAVTVCLGVAAMAQTPAAAPPPAESEPAPVTIASIIEGLKKSEQAITTLVVSHTLDSQANLAAPGKPLPAGMPIRDDAVSMRREGTARWEIERDGRGRIEADYLLTNSRFDGSQVKRRESWVSVFDGQTGTAVTTESSESGVVASRNRRPTDEFYHIGRSPWDFTTLYSGTRISDLIVQREGKIVESETWEQRPVVVVETTPITVRDDYIHRHQFWIDPARNHLVVRRQSYVQRGEGKPWGLHYQIDLLKNQEVAPGTWLPMSVVIENHHITSEGQGHLVGRDRIEISEWSVNTPLDASRFQLESSALDRVGTPIATPPQRSDNEPPRRDQPESDASAEQPPDGFRHMVVRTIDEQEQAAPSTGIHVSIWPSEQHVTLKRDYTTDANGRAVVLMPDPPRLVRIWTQKRGYVPLFAQWWPEHQPDGHIIPEEFVFSLPRGTEIGGVVKNEDGEPIEGAIVEVSLANRLDGMGRRPIPSTWLSEIPGPGRNPCITDAHGAWSLDNVPSGDEIAVRLKISHPQYVSDPRGTLQDEQSISMESLRDRSATIVMRRGIVVTGTVTDATGNPLPDAVVVWGDDPYSQEGSQEVRANAEGILQLAPLRPRPTNVTVVAAGWSPESRVIDISEADRTAHFRLKEGNLLRIQFLDTGGKPIPEVGVGIRGWRGAQSLYNYRHPNVIDTGIPVRADADGIYQWTWAPADEVKYSFYAKGFAAVERELKANGTEHTVTLEPNRASDD